MSSIATAPTEMTFIMDDDWSLSSKELIKERAKRFETYIKKSAADSDILVDGNIRYEVMSFDGPDSQDASIRVNVYDSTKARYDYIYGMIIDRTKNTPECRIFRNNCVYQD